MPDATLSRRQTLAALAALPAVLGTKSATAQPGEPLKNAPFKLSLNMSTIMGHKLGFIGELETAAKAGFRSVEIWVGTMQTYLKTNTTAEARRRISDLGLTVENAIGFAPWIVDDAAARQKGLEQMKAEMEQLAQLGCKRVAAPPIGAHTAGAPIIDLHRAAERYRTLLELGEQTGVNPQLELWGFSPNLNHVSDVLFVAAEASHPNARLLLDVYHLYKGGSGTVSLPLVGKSAIEVFHVNDYPSTLPAAQITDADRTYPGDGVAPIKAILNQIQDPARVGRNPSIVISLEVFNKSYYAQPADLVAKTAFQKMQGLVS